MRALLAECQNDPERVMALARALGRGAPPALLVLLPSEPRGPGRWAEMVRRMDAAETWGAALGAHDTQLIFDLDELLAQHAATGQGERQGPYKPPDSQSEIWVLDTLWTPALAIRLLRAGHTVARVGQNTSDAPITAAGAPFWRDLATTQAAMAWLKQNTPTLRRLTLLALREIPQTPTPSQIQEILDLPFELRIEALDREQLPQLLVAATPTGPEGVALLSLLGDRMQDPALLLLPAPESSPETLVASDLLLLGGRLLGGLWRLDALGRCQRALGQDLELIAHAQVVAGGRSGPAGFSLAARGLLLGEQRLPPQLALRERAGSPLIQLLECVSGPIPQHTWDPPELLTLGQPSSAEVVWLLRFPGDPDPIKMREQMPSVNAVLCAQSLLPNGLPRDIPHEARALTVLRIRRRLALHGLPTQDAKGQVLSAPPIPYSPGAKHIDLKHIDLKHIDLKHKLRVLCQAQLAPAQVLSLQLESGQARSDLLRYLAAARDRILLQTYIFQHDSLGESVVQALSAAALRGVQVRVLVDAIFGMEGPLRHNPVLQPLLAIPGVEVRGLRPPKQVLDLKRRSHRKLLVVDQAVARVSGRNLGAQYYTGFDQVPLAADSPASEVPWIDAGIDLRGPMLEHIATAFEHAWREAQGEPCPTQAAPYTDGDTALILHSGMDDANTLEAQRLLIESAERRITLVNTFPLQLELQALLLERLSQGIEVRFLVGNVRAQYNDHQPFAGGAVLELATQIVHGRLDPLVLAGAVVAEAQVPNPGGWSPAITSVLPHVHAKVLSIDGVRFGIGSANLDISAAYWESEAMLVSMNALLAAELERWLDAHFEQARRFDPDSPTWQRLAQQRARISHGWPSWMMV